MSTFKKLFKGRDDNDESMPPPPLAPRRLSSFTSFERFRVRPQSTSSGSGTYSGDQQQQVLARSLPSGGRTMGPRRIVSLESITDTRDRPALSRQSENLSLDATISNSGLTGSSSSSSAARAISLARHTVRNISNPLTQPVNRQILRQGRTYVHPNRRGMANNARGRILSRGPLQGRQQGFSQARIRRGSGRLNMGFWQEDTDDWKLASQRARGRYGGRFPQSEPPGAEPPCQSVQNGDFSSHSGPHQARERPAGRRRSIKQVVDPEDDDEFDGLELVGRQLSNDYADSFTTSSDLSNPNDRPTISRAHSSPIHDDKTVLRRQNELPVAIYSENGMEIVKPDLIRTQPQRFDRTKNDRLAIEYYATDDEDGAWIDEESWQCSEEELDADDDTDSESSEEDFGCIGLFVESYEEMLKAGKGFNQELVEIVDKWLVPDEVKNVGYRVIGRLGQREGEIGKRFGENENYRYLRKHRWLHGTNPVDDSDDEWEDDEDENDDELRLEEFLYMDWT